MYEFQNQYFWPFTHWHEIPSWTKTICLTPTTPNQVWTSFRRNPVTKWNLMNERAKLTLEKVEELLERQLSNPGSPGQTQTTRIKSPVWKNCPTTAAGQTVIFIPDTGHQLSSGASSSLASIRTRWSAYFAVPFRTQTASKPGHFIRINDPFQERWLKCR